MPRKRKIIFVCSGVSNSGDLITSSISASSSQEAEFLFHKENSFLPQDILGPFYKKRKKYTNSNILLKFSDKSSRAIYNNWIVNALYLLEPAGQAFLLFIKRTDNKTISPPKGTVVVPISELQVI